MAAAERVEVELPSQELRLQEMNLTWQASHWAVVGDLHRLVWRLLSPLPGRVCLMKVGRLEDWARISRMDSQMCWSALHTD